MDGLAGVFTLTGVGGGAQEDIEEDTAVDIIEDIEEEEMPATEQAIGQGVEIHPEMYIAIDPTV